MLLEKKDLFNFMENRFEKEERKKNLFQTSFADSFKKPNLLWMSHGHSSQLNLFAVVSNPPYTPTEKLFSFHG